MKNMNVVACVFWAIFLAGFIGYESGRQHGYKDGFARGQLDTIQVKRWPTSTPNAKPMTDLEKLTRDLGCEEELKELNRQQEIKQWKRQRELHEQIRQQILDQFENHMWLMKDVERVIGRLPPREDPGLREKEAFRSDVEEYRHRRAMEAK
jgi:hypothetical protein